MPGWIPQGPSLRHCFEIRVHLVSVDKETETNVAVVVVVHAGSVSVYSHCSC